MIMMVVVMPLTGCIKGVPLASGPADRGNISGTFDLVLYGCRYPNDLETAAFLVYPSRAEQFDLYALSTSYKVKKGLSAEAALAQADSFVNCGVRTVENMVIRSISDGAGGVIGYELIPHYSPMDEGGQMPLMVNYSLRDGKVTVFIRLDPLVEFRLDSVSPQGSGAP